MMTTLPADSPTRAAGPPLVPAAAPAEVLTLSGRRILVTRSAEQARDLAELLRAQGAAVVVVPTLEFFPPDDTAPLDLALERLARYDWVAFTSANAVRFCCERLVALELSVDSLAAPRLAAVGPATARALEARGLVPALVPAHHEAISLATAMAQSKAGLVGRRVLVPQGDQARPDLARALGAAGAFVEVVVAYANRPAPAPADLEAVLGGGVDLVTLASPTAARHLADLARQPGAPAALRAVLAAPAATIGPQTSEAARACGFAVVAEAARHTAGGLAQAVIAWMSLPRSPR